MVGSTISHYKILEKIGEGGMGIVYKAHDTKLDRFVALKFLPHHLTANEAEKARFLQEAKAASALNHPNVCTIYGIGEHDGQQFIEMEFVDGETLRQRNPIAKMSELLTFAIQIADALHEAHAKGIVHRDIKADNIMLNAKNQVKVMDFGLAKLKGSLKLTRTSSTVGTLAYMAPEQIQGQEVDHRSDIFSFAVVLFEMITGKLPFRGDHEAAIMYSILNEEPESAQSYRADISAEFLHILHRGLEKDPADRYQSIQEMLIDLRRLQKQSTKVTRMSAASMPVGARSAPDSETGGDASRLPRHGASRTWIGIGAIVVVVLAGIAVWLVLSNHFSRPGASFASIRISRLTTSGRASIAAISPDGKYVVHVVNDGEKRSLWTRQVATRSDVEIVHAADMQIRSVAFSADGNFIYYTARNSEFPGGMLFEIPVLGGTPRKIVGDVATGASISPDGKKIAFIRQYHNEGEESLLLTNIDGTGERKLASRKGDEFFVSGEGVVPAWSPNGDMIAISSASNIGVQHINLVAYSVLDGSQKLLSKENWKQIGRITWLPDGSGLAFIGIAKNTTKSQIWFISYPEGSTRSITNDLSSYDERALAVTADGTMLTATNVELRSNIWVLKKSTEPKETWNVGEARQLTSGVSTQDGSGGMSWVDDRRLLYTSLSSKYWELWMSDIDGTHRQELPFDDGGAYYPAVSIDGKSVAFVSDRDSTPHIYVAEIDGENARRVTNAEDYFPSITPDKKWITYTGWATGKVLLYKIPFGGGDTVNLSECPSREAFISPDGKRLVCTMYDTTKGEWSNAIVSMDGRVIRMFRLPYSAETNSVRWHPDGVSITYIDTREGVSNIWKVPSAGGEPTQLTKFSSGLIFWFAWSRNGENLAVARGDITSDVVLMTDASGSKNPK